MHCPFTGPIMFCAGPIFFVPDQKCIYILVPSMCFGQSLGRPIVRSFSHFFGRPKKKIVQSQGNFGQSLILFGQVSDFFV